TFVIPEGITRNGVDISVAYGTKMSTEPAMMRGRLKGAARGVPQPLCRAMVRCTKRTAVRRPKTKARDTERVSRANWNYLKRSSDAGRRAGGLGRSGFCCDRGSRGLRGLFLGLDLEQGRLAAQAH